jgi:hypothetical protein
VDVNWDAVGAVGEIIGAAAVLVTLIYLALQIRQNTYQNRLNSIQAINASNDSAFDPIYIPENTVIFTKGQSSYEHLTEHEKVVFDMLMMRLFASLDSTTYHYQQKSYDKELFRGVMEFYSGFISSPGGRKWYQLRSNSISKDTRDKLERYLGSHVDT